MISSALGSLARACPALAPWLRRAVFASLQRTALILCLAPAAGEAQGGFALLTPEDLLDPGRSATAEVTRSMSLVANAGPHIRVAAPNGFALTSPVDFDIRIEPRDDVPVSMQSLRIDYRIGPLWKDVTARVARHGRISGNRLLATGAELPSGRHTLRLTVSDAEARETVAIVKIAVR
jgi:hypothetical protein